MSYNMWGNKPKQETNKQSSINWSNKPKPEEIPYYDPVNNIYTEADVEKVHDHMFNLLGEAGCSSIDGLYYSETSLRADGFAKPNIGMFKRCEEQLPFIKFSKGYFVGDKISDLKAAFKVGARPVLVLTGHGQSTLKELNKFSNQKIKKKTIIFDDLAQFADSLG